MNNQAIIVKINKIDLHPNADKIALAKLFGTQVVVGKDAKVGDILVYVDSNMKMSEEFLSKNNLFRHCELNEDKTQVGFFEDHGRVKCIKMRGEISDGFLFPLEYLSYLGQTPTEIGTEFDSVNGIKFCEKYVPVSKQQSQGTGSSKLVKKIAVPMFKEHFDTEQFMKNQHQIPAGTICYLEEKIHGTSHRTGLVQYPSIDLLPLWKRIFIFILGMKNITTWMYLNGTRRVIHTPKIKTDTFYDNTMREEILEKVRGSLFKGEQLYIELFGHEKTGTQIQKNFPYNTNSKEYRSLLYRVTMNNEDGHIVDYNREAVYLKAEELGFEKPHLFEKYYYDGTEESMKILETKVIAYAQGKSDLNTHVVGSNLEIKNISDTLKEGVVIWFINSKGIWKALKYKSDAFRLGESGLKDAGEVDQEDTN